MALTSLTSLTPNKNITDLMCTGCAEGTPLCETHCKPRSGAAVGTTMRRKLFRKAGLVHPADNQWHKSPLWGTVSCVIITHSCAAPRLAVGFA